MLSKKDEKFRDELLTALSESISARNNSNYSNSFKIIEHLVTIDESSLYEKQLLMNFQSLVDSFPQLTSVADLNAAEYLAAFLDSFNLIAAKSSSDIIEQQIMRIVEKLVDYCVLPEFAHSTIYSNERIVGKLSLVLKSFVLK